MEQPFRHWEIAPGLTAILCPGYLPGPGRLPGYGRTIVCLATGRDRALLFDTGFGNADLKRYVEEITALPLVVVNSHAHPDHLGGNGQFDTVYIGRNEVLGPEPIFIPDNETPHPRCAAVRGGGGYRFAFLDDRQKIDLGGRVLEVIEIPGHTRGSIALLDHGSGYLLSGDAILKRVLLLGGVSIRRYRAALEAVDALEFKDIYGAHWPEPLGRGYIRKVLALLDDFDPARAERAPWQEIDAEFAMFAHGSAFEDADFCAVGYRTDQLELLLG